VERRNPRSLSRRSRGRRGSDPARHPWRQRQGRRL